MPLVFLFWYNKNTALKKKKRGNFEIFKWKRKFLNFDIFIKFYIYCFFV